MAEKLTDKHVNDLPAPERGQKIYFDTEIKGFGVRVLASGIKSFVLDYWGNEGQRRMTIGRYGKRDGAWTVARARERAKELRREIDGGGDPLGTREKLRTAPTVAKLCDRYIDEHLPEKAEKSQHEDKRCIKKEILPQLGKRKVAAVHFGDIKALHRAITERGSPVQANRTVALLSKMFSMSLVPKEGETEPWRTPVQGNPCKGIERNNERGRERFYTEAELSRIAAALDTYNGKPTANLLKLVMLTGARPGECRLATWDQIDLETGEWIKPGSQTKQKTEHQFPLSPPALLLLQEIHKTAPDDCGYIFPGRKTNASWQPIDIGGYKRAWKHVVREAKLKPDKRGNAPRPYDLRHSVASHALGLGLPIGIIGQLLGHASSKTTEKYLHALPDPLREAADKIGGHIANVGKDSDNVEKIEDRS